MSQQEIIDYYDGIAPKEWVEHSFTGAESTKQIQQVGRHVCGLKRFTGCNNDGLSQMQIRIALMSICASVNYNHCTFDLIDFRDQF